jgi:RNA polymerase sigma-70 factor, ECF subfamily
MSTTLTLDRLLTAVVGDPSQPTSAATDRQLLDGLRARDPLACRELLVRYGARLYRIVHASHRDRDLAEDVVQETFIRAMRAADTLREEASLFAWLVQIAHRVAIDLFRRDRRLSHEEVELVSRERPDTSAEAAESSGRVRAALDRLKPGARELIVLRYYAGFSVAEMARVQEKSETAVRKELQRARDRLRKILGGAWEGDV